MNIFLVASDNKKELMVQFCQQNKTFLSKNVLFATASTGRIIELYNGLFVQKCLGGTEGGFEQISAAIACGEVDVLFFFRDSGNKRSTDNVEQDIIRLCDIYNIPIALNIASAEMFIKSYRYSEYDSSNINSFQQLPEIPPRVKYGTKRKKSRGI